MSDLITNFLKQYEQLKLRRMSWESTWEEIATYILPRKSEIISDRTPGVKQTRKLFDSTAIEANERLAAAISGSVTNPVTQWFSFDLPRTNLAQLGRQYAVDAWLQEVSSSIFRQLRLSNFNTEIGEVYLDIGAFGTGAIYVDERVGADEWNGLQFRSLHLGEYVIGEDADGLVNTVFRDVKMSAQAAVEKWGSKAVSTKVLEIARNRPHEELRFVHAVIPRTMKINSKIDEFPYVSFYIDQQYHHMMSMGGYNEFPFMVGRWAKASGEVYGRGPGFTALPDVQSLNKADELGLRAWAKAIDPPILSLHDAVLGTPDLRPSRLNIVTEMGALQPFPQATNMQLDNIKREDKRNSIRRIFFMDQVQFIPERGKTPATAMDIQARMDIMLQILGPTLARLEFELLQPLIDRVFSMMMRKGMIPPPPQEVMNAAEIVGGQIDVEFRGPIARAKRRSESISIQNSVGYAMQLAQVMPEIMDLFNPDAIARQLSYIEGTPQGILRPFEEVMQIRQQRQQQQQQMAQAQMVKEGSEVVRNVRGNGASR